MITYVENNGSIKNIRQIDRRVNIHILSPITKSFKWKNPTYVVCSIEESVERKVVCIENTRGRVFSRRRKHLSVCDNTNCNTVYHSSCPTESEMRVPPQFNGMKYF